MRIKKIAQPLQPKSNNTNKMGRIEEIKMKIANIEQMIANGFIDPEEGKFIIENLQEQIVQIKNEMIEEPIPQEYIEQEIETQNEIGDKKDYEYGKDDFYSQQALYNKTILGLN